MRNKLIFLDLETAGLTPKHPDIQVAAIATANFQEIDAFEAKISFDPEQADPEALKLNNFDPKVWQLEAVPESVVVEGLSQFLRKHATIERVSKKNKPYRIARLAGHNIARFDGQRLLAMFKRHEKFLSADAYRPLDTMQLALWHFAGRPDEPANYQLPTLAAALGVQTPNTHDALADARTALFVARTIIQRGVR